MAPRRHRHTLAVSLVTVALVACGDDEDAGIVEGIAAGEESSDRARSYDDVFAALPDAATRFACPKQDDHSQLVVEGQIVDVQPGASMSWEEDDDGERRTILPFGADGAESSTLHLQVDVTSVVAANAGLDTENVGTIQVGLPVRANVDVDAAREELRELGTVVLFLSRSPVFVYDSGHPETGPDPSAGVWAILESGGFLGTVAANDSIEFPAMSPDARNDLLPDQGVTLDKLIAAAGQ